MTACPSCGQENPDGAKFCMECAAPLSVPARAAAEERKVVTVLFCDLVGFTAKAEQLDPEDVRAVLGPYHARLRSELERHGGTVEKFIGDAVMALFGAPTAHEDDPERAVRAALAIRDFAVKEGLELRLGVTTGEALVSLGASPSEGEGMASGDVVNTAARLQTAAPVNGILVDAPTYRSTHRAIEYREASSVEVKGKTAPIAVWEATTARSRFGVDVAHEARTELVGRERELDVVRDAFERARHERTPQLLTLVGVPGIGKSRLVYELSRIVDDDPELITWRQGRCLAYGDGVTLWALSEIVKAQAGILEQDTPSEVEQALRDAVVDVLGDSEDAGWVVSELRSLVGLSTEPELGGDRRGAAFAAWRRFLEALAEQRPLVLVFEDLHWADESLLDFVDELVGWVTDVPLLVVATARPELLERRPGWGGGKLNATTLALAPLSEEQTARLLAQLLDRPVLAAEDQQSLLERAGGNPLYAEQFAELFLERGSAADLPLPESLQGIIAARLDGLGEPEKELLRDAAVVGKVFWPSALRGDSYDVGSTLHALGLTGFVRRQKRSSIEGEAEFAFAHALVRDVAYGQIPRAERSAKHRRAAEWIESLGRFEDHAEMRAYHWRSALELAQASGGQVDDLTNPARLALRDAGDRAHALNSFAAAAALYHHALELWPADDPERPHLLYQYAHALSVAGDARAEEMLEAARDALLAGGNWQAAAEPEIALSRICWEKGEIDRARAHQDSAEKLAGDTPSRATARVLASIARARTIGGDPSEGLRLATAALEMAESLQIDELRAHALATVGLAKVDLGDRTTGLADEARALELAIAANSPVAGPIANNIAVHALGAFELRRADDLYHEASRIAERFGDAPSVRWLRPQHAWTALLLGRWDEALALLDGFIAECEAGLPHYLEGQCRSQRGWMRQARCDHHGAIVDFEKALALARFMSEPQDVVPNLGTIVAGFEVEGREDEARAIAQELIALSHSHPREAEWAFPVDFLLTHVALTFEPDLREVFEWAPAGPSRDIFAACLDRDFVRAAEIWAAAESPTWEARCRLRAAEELIETGRRSEGRVELAKAIAYYSSVGATFHIQRGEALLAKTA